MTTNPQPPPEARLITTRREAAPRESIRQAAARAGISDTRWRQIETGRRMFRGEPYPETAPPEILARMARAVGVTAAELEDAGRGDAAAELAELPGDGSPPREASREQLAGVIDRLSALEKLVRGGNGGGTASGRGA